MSTRSTRKQRRSNVRDAKDSRKFFVIVAVSTLALVVLMYFIYKGL